MIIERLGVPLCSAMLNKIPFISDVLNSISISRCFPTLNSFSKHVKEIIKVKGF